MSNLKDGFAQNNIKDIMEVLNDKKLNLMADPLFTMYKDDLLRNVYLNALESLCKPYKTVKLAFLSARLNLDIVEIRSLLSELILEEKIMGKIDQVNGMVELSAKEAADAQKHRAIQ
jgi:COP9 signalosome complex subunit 2